MIWIFDRINIPPSFPRKNRYILFEEINEHIIFFHSGENDFYRNRQKTPKDFQYDGNRYLRCAVFGSRIFSYITFSITSMFKALFLKEKPNIVIGSCPDPFQSLAAFLVSKAKKSKFIVDFRDYWPELLVEMNKIQKKSFKRLIIYLITRFLAKKADGVIAPTDYIVSYLINRGLYSKKYYILENLPSINNIIFENSEISNMIINYKSIGRKVLLLVGRANFSKIPVKLTNALKRYNYQNKNLQIIILSNSQVYLKLKESLSKEGLSVQLYNPLRRSQYMKCLRLADALLVINDSLGNFSSNKVNDSLLLGTPVLFLVEDKKLIDSGAPGLFLIDKTNEERFLEKLQLVFKHYGPNERKKTKEALEKKIKSQKESLKGFLENI